VVEFPRLRTLHGSLAYFAWLGIHLVLLSEMRTRIETLWNWGWSAQTHDRAARIIIEGEERRGALRDPMYRLQLSEGGVSHGE
jgi:hypothetical protein